MATGEIIEFSLIPCNHENNISIIKIRKFKNELKDFSAANKYMTPGQIYHNVPKDSTINNLCKTATVRKFIYRQ